MKTIRDIRLYASSVQDKFGYIDPFGTNKNNRSANLMARRVTMKLREGGFSLGEFDHLYLIFTVCLPVGTIIPSKKPVDKLHSWHREYEVGISQKLFDKYEQEESVVALSEHLEQTLIKFFAPDETLVQQVKNAVKEAVSKGPEMLMRFKEKKAAKTRAVIFLSLLDSAEYLPVLCVYDLQGNELLHEPLAKTNDFSSLGDIQLSSKKVTIKPRKNVFAKELEPVTFFFE